MAVRYNERAIMHYFDPAIVGTPQPHVISLVVPHAKIQPCKLMLLGNQLKVDQPSIPSDNRNRHSRVLDQMIWQDSCWHQSMDPIKILNELGIFFL